MPTETDDFEDNLCPMCLEELDITDRNFKPCQCGYQVLHNHRSVLLFAISFIHWHRCAGFVGTTLRKTLMEDAQLAALSMMQTTTNSLPQTL